MRKIVVFDWVSVDGYYADQTEKSIGLCRAPKLTTLLTSG